MLLLFCRFSLAGLSTQLVLWAVVPSTGQWHKVINVECGPCNGSHELALHGKALVLSVISLTGKELVTLLVMSQVLKHVDSLKDTL